MEHYKKPQLMVLTMSLVDRVMADDDCEGTIIFPGGGNFRYDLTGPSLSEFLAGNSQCVMTILDALIS